MNIVHSMNFNWIILKSLKNNKFFLVENSIKKREKKDSINKPIKTSND